VDQGKETRHAHIHAVGPVEVEMNTENIEMRNQKKKTATKKMKKKT
jgi:hypothetical protein